MIFVQVCRPHPYSSHNSTFLEGGKKKRKWRLPPQLKICMCTMMMINVPEGGGGGGADCVYRCNYFHFSIHCFYHFIFRGFSLHANRTSLKATCSSREVKIASVEIWVRLRRCLDSFGLCVVNINEKIIASLLLIAFRGINIMAGARLDILRWKMESNLGTLNLWLIC